MCTLILSWEAWNEPVLISILSLVNHVCIMSDHFSDFSHIIANYIQIRPSQLLNIWQGLYFRLFCFHFCQSFIQNRRTAQIVVHARGWIWMKIIAKWLPKDEIELYNMQQIFRYDEFDWNCNEIEWKILNLVDLWRIWMKKTKSTFDTRIPAFLGQNWSYIWTKRVWNERKTYS